MKHARLGVALALAAGLAVSSRSMAQYAVVTTMSGSFVPGVDQAGNLLPVSGVDDGTALVTIPPVYGNNILPAGSAYASTNGRLIALDDITYFNTPLAADSVAGYYPMWDDLGVWPGDGGSPTTTGVGDEGIYALDTGTVFVIQWNGRPYNEGVSGVPSPVNRFKMQLQIRASGPAVAQFIYQGLGGITGQAATIGVVPTTPSGVYSQFSADQGGVISDTTVLSVVAIPTGGCCIPSTLQCIDTDTANCANQAGVYHGDGTTCAQANCPSPGACCLEDGTCIQATPAACAIQNGVYHGDSSVCGTCPPPPSGACCAPDGTCAVRTTIACRGVAGLFRGANSTCGAGVCPRSYAYTGGSQPVPDGTGSDGCGSPVFADIVVPDSFTLGAADASVFMTATWQGDMQFALVHQETGTTAWLAQRPGVGPDSTYGFANTNYGNAGSAVPFRAADLGVAIYNAPPTGALVDGIDNVSGLWRPQNPLSVFAGENASGTWRIMAQDCAGDFTGSLDGFILNLTPAGSTSSCYANCDHSTAVPFLNVQDFSCFLAKFASSDAYANCDNSTTPPVLNVQDFSCFLSKFATGCSAP